MSCHPSDVSKPQHVGLAGNLSKHGTRGTQEVVLFCFSRFLLSKCSCFSNHHAGSSPQTQGRKSALESQLTTNTTAVHGKCLYAFSRTWEGLAKELTGKEGYNVAMSSHHFLVALIIFSLPSVYRPVPSSLLCAYRTAQFTVLRRQQHPPADVAPKRFIQEPWILAIIHHNAASEH